jgi:hypothetical protein
MMKKRVSAGCALALLCSIAPLHAQDATQLAAENPDLVLAAALALTGCILAIVAAFPRLKPLPERAPSAPVVVLVHGWRFGRRFWEPFLSLAQRDQQFANYQFFRFNYRLLWFTRQSLPDVAKTLQAEMIRFDRRELYLVGVGIGALVARSAYLDLIDAEKPSGADTRITHLILLAPPNHGLGAHRRSVLLFLRRLVGGHPLRDASSGSDFMVNLRLRWLRALSEGRLTANISQIRAANDRYVTEADTWDVSCAPDRAHVVPGTHRRLARPRDADDVRYLALKDCILGRDPQPREGIEPDTPRPATQSEVRALLFLVPGIRDWGFRWRHRVKKLVDRKYAGVKIVPAQYGWFSTWDFLVRRRKRVRQWTDAYSREMALLADQPEVRSVVLAHSYGTYAVARALCLYSDIKLDRVYFAGSVLKQTFEWHSLRPNQLSQLSRFRNACGTNDYWVGLMSNGLGLIFRDLGAAGFLGFETPPPNSDVIKLTGGHSAFSQDGALENAIDFLLADGIIACEPGPDPGTVGEQLAQWAPMLFLIVVGAAFVTIGALAWWLSGYGLPFLVGGLPRREILAAIYGAIGVMLLLKYV